MKTILAALAAVSLSVAVGTAPSHAGQWDWLGNKDYVNCLKLMSAMSEGGIWSQGRTYSGAEREARYDRGRRYCNRQYYGHD